MNVLGLDVGGANLKAADGRGVAKSERFALWKDPAGLPDALRKLLATMPKFDRVGLTMTGELCDCFESRRQGVVAILDAVASVVDVPVFVWTLDGGFVDVAAARSKPLRAAAANWLAEATLFGRLAPKGPALLLDIGSTTTDIIPLEDGKPVPKGRTDSERLECGELVYSGVRRTPAYTLLKGDGAAELFATTHDLYLALGWVEGDPDDHDTADGRPATKSHAHARLARMICSDLETITAKKLESIKHIMLARHVYSLAFSVEHVAKRLSGPPQLVILAGSGEFLAQPVLRQQTAFPPCSLLSLERDMGAHISTAACAHAVALLVSEVAL